MQYSKRYLLLFVVIFSLLTIAILNVYIDLLGVEYLFAQQPLFELEPQRQFITFILMPIIYALIFMLFGVWIYKQNYSLAEKAALIVTMIFALFLATTSIWQFLFFPLHKGSFDFNLNDFDQPFATPFFVPFIQIKWTIAINGVMLALFLTLMYDVFVDRKASPFSNMIKAIVYYTTGIFLTIALASYYTSLDFGDPISSSYRLIGIIGLICSFLILTLLLPYVEANSTLFKQKQKVPGIVDII